MGQSGAQVDSYAPYGPPPKKPMSLWAPMSFLILWILFSAVGGGLYAIGISRNYWNCDDPNNCYVVADGAPLAYAGMGCLGLSGIFGLIFWIVFIVWIVKRTRARPKTVYVHNAPQMTA
jgi:hypothetical protein